MLATVCSAAVLGVNSYLVQVEVDLSNGLPTFSTVGLPDGAVRESKERVRAALTNSGFAMPVNRVTVNLAPADIKKEGAGFDLPMALGILAASGTFPPEALEGAVVVGELALDGQVRPVKGVLPMAVAASRGGRGKVIAPARNAGEAAVVEGVEVYPVDSLLACVRHLMDLERISPLPGRGRELLAQSRRTDVDMSDVKGQEHVKRALTIAAAGGHNVLMVGPPGSGKTMLARRLATILPPLSFEEALEVTQVASVAGALPPDHSLVAERPFRSPHHTISDAGLVGGGSIPRPGEVSLAHNGVLFLDELPEFKKSVLEVMRQPLEAGTVTVTRAAASLEFPARFMLVAAMNPCPCGYYGDPRRACACSLPEVRRYMNRVSGPLMDRIDLQVQVPAVPFKDLSAETAGPSSAELSQVVVTARQIQEKRFASLGIYANAQMSSKLTRIHCQLDGPNLRLLETAMERFKLSARAYGRILKIARTIADLDSAAQIGMAHLSEAIGYRSLDRGVI